MRIRKLSALLLSLAMLLGLLSGCGGGDEAAGCGGGDEAEITAEDFYGCWEYADYDMWVCFYDDGTFEWYSDGLDSTGTYSMDGVELHLDDDSERFFVTDGEGGLMDWDGDALFAARGARLRAGGQRRGLLWRVGVRQPGCVAVHPGRRQL